jgi:hypothetical protein
MPQAIQSTRMDPHQYRKPPTVIDTYSAPSVALLHQLIVGLKELLGSRFGKPGIVVTTMEKRQYPVRAFIPKVFSDWPSTKARDEVLVLVLGNLGNVSVIPANSMQHSRQLRIELSSGDA